MSLDNINNLEIIAFDPKETPPPDGRKKNSSSKPLKESWTESSLLVVLVAYQRFRLAGVGHGEVTHHWNPMMDEENMKDSEVLPLYKNAVKGKFEELMRQIDRASGSGKHTPIMELNSRKAYGMYVEDLNSSKGEKLKKI